MGRERYSPQEQAFYRSYLNGPQWKARRAARIKKAGGQCEYSFDDFKGPAKRCQRKRYIQVHHNTYERLGAEYDGDLDVLCWAHHMLEHLLWKSCSACTKPCLVNEEVADKWLTIMLGSMGINLDSGPINWRVLPAKEILLDQIPHMCGLCRHYIYKE